MVRCLRTILKAGLGLCVNGVSYNLLRESRRPMWADSAGGRPERESGCDVRGDAVPAGGEGGGVGRVRI